MNCIALKHTKFFFYYWTPLNEVRRRAYYFPLIDDTRLSQSIFGKEVCLLKTSIFRVWHVFTVKINGIEIEYQQHKSTNTLLRRMY